MLLVFVMRSVQNAAMKLFGSHVLGMIVFVYEADNDPKVMSPLVETPMELYG
jgi:hypothetical protein